MLFTLMKVIISCRVDEVYSVCRHSVNRNTVTFSAVTFARAVNSKQCCLPKELTETALGRYFYSHKSRDSKTCNLADFLHEFRHKSLESKPSTLYSCLLDFLLPCLVFYVCAYSKYFSYMAFERKFFNYNQLFPTYMQITLGRKNILTLLNWHKVVW